MRNMGVLDRTIRFICALLLAILYLINVISGIVALILLIIALLLLITSAIGICPVYMPLKWDTHINFKSAE
jgi:DMSO/TMAO reductase YedYZ heme-binding membrane subunit